jgi:hypothetical protein
MTASAGALPRDARMDIVTSARVDAAPARIKGLSLEMPGVSLDTEQACHLTGLDASPALLCCWRSSEEAFCAVRRRVISCSGTSAPAWTITKGEAHGH